MEERIADALESIAKSLRRIADAAERMSPGPAKTTEEADADAAHAALLRRGIDGEFSGRVLNCLLGDRYAEKVGTFGDLVKHSARGLRERRNFGDGCLKEVRQKLASLGLRLAGD